MEPHRVAVPVLDGMPLFEIGVAGEVFGMPRPDLLGRPYLVELCSVVPGPVRTQGAEVSFAAGAGLEELVDQVEVRAGSGHPPDATTHAGMLLVVRIVVAPDSFKGSLSAAEVASAVADGVLDAAPDAVVTRLPMADGGEGTLDALLAVWGGDALVTETVDAIGRPTSARWAVSPDGRTAVVELAEATGIRR